MELYKYFNDEYVEIDGSGNEKKDFINAFLDNEIENDQFKYYDPLKKVFIHKTQREMFLILDCLKYKSTSIKKICGDWEKRVLAFINFGSEFRDEIEFLKYNIFLLILCQDEIGEFDDDFRYEAEKSLNICRKIFLICDENGDLRDNETIIPFYFAPITNINNVKTEEFEIKLKELLPTDEKILSILKKEDKLDQSEIQNMCGWLNNDNN